MRSSFALVAALGLILAATACGDDGSEEALFVINAPSASVEGATLTLSDVPAVLFFADRPERDVGHMTVADYVRIWTPTPEDPDLAPPNAELSMLSSEGTPAGVVLVLESVAGDSSTLTFSIDVLKGQLPDSVDLGPVALFVDACDPASPLCSPY